MIVKTADADDLALEYEGGVLSDQDQIAQHALESDPNVFIAPGVAQHMTTQAMKESHDDKAMSATFAIVTRGKEPNRYNRFIQIMPSDHGQGARLEEYEPNPIVLYDHGCSGLSIPVGLSTPQGGKLSVKLSKSKATATCYFSKLPHAEPIYAAVSEDLLRMASIGFSMDKIMLGKVNGNQALPEGVMLACDYRPIDVVEWRLMEWSITALGADAGALRQALERGKIHDVRIPQFLRQSWLTHAEKPKPQVQGVDITPNGVIAATAPKSVQRAVPDLGVTLSGDETAVAAAFQRLTAQPAAPATAVPPAPVVEQSISIDPVALAATITQGLQIAVPQPSLDPFAPMIQKAIADGLKPIADQLAATEQRLKVATGKLD